MSSAQYQEMTRQAVQGKFGDNTVLQSKTIPRYPKSAEREFKRVINSYMKSLGQSLRSRLPYILAAYNNTSDIPSLTSKINQEVMTIGRRLEQEVYGFELDSKVEAIAEQTRKITEREWQNAVKKTLGVDLLYDYYTDSFYGDGITVWNTGNVKRVKNLPIECLESIQKLIIDMARQDLSTPDLKKAIQAEYDSYKRLGQQMVRDQVAKLNAQLSKMQQEDAGATKYVWVTQGDDRVRECHQELEGKIFSWDNPPEMWYVTKSQGIVFTGRRCNPGEDYGCRCRARPVFELSTLNVPIVGKNQVK